MAEYLLDKGVSQEAQQSFEKLLSTAKEISAALGGEKNLTALTKQAAAASKIVEQTNLLIERQKTQQALQEKAAAAQALNEKKYADALERRAQAEQRANERLKQKTGYINSLEKEVKDLTAAYASLSEAELKGTAQSISLDNKHIAVIKAKKAEMDSLKKQIDINYSTIEKNNIKVSKGKISAGNADYFNSYLKEQIYYKQKAYNALEVEIRELTTATNQLNNAESKGNANGPQMLLNLKNKRAELAALKAAYGDNRMYVGEYSRGVNGLKQSFSMLAGEMPNFAQSFRIGMMSLSNNWMGLSQAISIARTEQKQYMEQFKAGLIDKKPDSLFKMITKSIFSMNLVLMVAVTIMQLYNEEIGNFIENLFNAKDAAEKFNEEFKKVNEEMSKSMATEYQKIYAFVNDYRLAHLKADKAKLEQLDEINKKEWKLNDDRLAMITKTKDGWKAAFAEYLQLAQDAYTNEVIFKMNAEDRLKGEQAMTSAKMKYSKAVKEQSFSIMKGGKKQGSTTTDEFLGNDQKAYTIAQLYNMASDESASETIFETFRVWGVAQDIVDDLRIVFQTNQSIKLRSKMLKKAYTNRESKEVGGRKGGGSDPKFQEINVMREYYKSEEELLKRLAALEDDITRSTLDGELNSYEKRTKAAELYYSTVKNMSEVERFVAIENIKAKTAAEKRAIKQKYENNVTRFGAGSVEAMQSANELAVGNATIESNEADAILKVNDKFTKDMLDAAKKRQKDLFAINQDMYADDVYSLEQAEKRKLEIMNMYAEAEKQALKTMSLGDMALSGIGIGKDTRRDDISLRADQELRKKKAEQEKLLRSLKGASGEQKKEIWRQLEQSKAQEDIIKQQEKADQEILLMQVTEDAKASIVENSVETLKTLWDNYYEYLNEQIDSQLEKDTKINDERVKQYEDETKAGLHTAEELDKFKERSTAYQTSLEEEAARKSKELEKEKFLFQQAMALGQIWIDFAINSGKYPELVAWLLGQAIANTALVAAQTIPAFAEGGDMLKDGKAILGDGGKHELAIAPDGSMFISGNTPALYDLQKGTHIFPDVNKVDLMSVLAAKQVMPNSGRNSEDMLLRELIKTVKNQKQGNFYGMPLIKQMNMSDRYSSRKRSLMN